MQHTESALLVLADPSGNPEVFEGKFFGKTPDAPLHAEVVFNTSMTGYQEILTDPSYAGQMICFTAAHIGNTGANSEDVESSKIHAEAMLIASLTDEPSNYRSEQSLNDFLVAHQKVGVYDLDTRALTLMIRDQGVATGFVMKASQRDQIPALLESIKAQKSEYDQTDWILKVTTDKPHEVLASEYGGKSEFKVVVYDYGVKAQLLRDLASRGCDLIVVPADYPAEKVLAQKPDGVFLSNGPGDPSLATYAVKNVQALLGKLPIFGVCMGNQVLGLALGAKAYKLKFGHRGGNQPVKNLETGLVEISAHNHGYALDTKTLPKEASLSHVNLNDDCCEGIDVPSMNAFSVQYHPESSPGPHDSSYLFDRFIRMMRK